MHERTLQFQAELFTTQLTISQPDIVAPHDFGFQLRHYVIAPEVREAQKLVEIVRLATGQLVKVDVESKGVADAPLIDVTICSPRRLSSVEVAEVRAGLVWHLSLDDALKPFYAIAAGDPVLSASIAHNFGAKGKRTHSLFDGLIDVILFQNVTFRRAYAMRASLNAEFGDRLSRTGGFTTPRRRPRNLPPPRWRRSERSRSATAIATSRVWPQPS